MTIRTRFTLEELDYLASLATLWNDGTNCPYMGPDAPTFSTAWLRASSSSEGGCVMRCGEYLICVPAPDVQMSCAEVQDWLEAVQSEGPEVKDAEVRVQVS